MEKKLTSKTVANELFKNLINLNNNDIDPEKTRAATQTAKEIVALIEAENHRTAVLMKAKSMGVDVEVTYREVVD